MENEQGVLAAPCAEYENLTAARQCAEAERVHFDRVLSIALGVATGLLSCGASVSRVEIAVERICFSCGAKEVNVFALPSMVLCSIKLADGSEIRIREEKLDNLNSRTPQGALTLELPTLLPEQGCEIPVIELILK